MKRAGKISLALPADQASHIRRLVEEGEFPSASEVVREAIRAWLHRRALHAGRLGVERLSRSFEARRDPPEPFERVELLFDAGDAKA